MAIFTEAEKVLRRKLRKNWLILMMLCESLDVGRFGGYVTFKKRWGFRGVSEVKITIKNLNKNGEGKGRHLKSPIFEATKHPNNPS